MIIFLSRLRSHKPVDTWPCCYSEKVLAHNSFTVLAEILKYQLPHPSLSSAWRLCKPTDISDLLLACGQYHQSGTQNRKNPLSAWPPISGDHKTSEKSKAARFQRGFKLYLELRKVLAPKSAFHPHNSISLLAFNTVEPVLCICSCNNLYPIPCQMHWWAEHRGRSSTKVGAASSKNGSWEMRQAAHQPEGMKGANFQEGAGGDPGNSNRPWSGRSPKCSLPSLSRVTNPDNGRVIITT